MEMKTLFSGLELNEDIGENNDEVRTVIPADKLHGGNARGTRY
jgi:hypothetical protein